MSSLLAVATSGLDVLHRVDPVPEESEVIPGTFYMFLVIGLIVALVLLWLSLRRHLKRINVDRSAPGREPGLGERRDG